MTLKLDWERLPTHAVVRIGGAPSLDDALAVLDEVAARMEDGGSLLVDLRGITSLTKFTEQFALGQAVAQRLRHLRRVASVVPPERVTRNTERPARRGGVDLKVFDSEDEALAWVTSA